MDVTIYPSQLKGTIQAPASKSSMQRACAAALVSPGTTLIHKPGHSNDDKAAIGIIEALGATVTAKGEALEIVSRGVHPKQDTIYCGESGLSIRMFTPLAALADQPITIDGAGSLRERPMHFFDDVMPQLGVRINSNEGKLPLQVQGPVHPASITVDGSLSSQFLTGLLLAYAAAGANDIELRVNNLKSKPYIRLTLDVMRQFGLGNIENREDAVFVFHPAPPPGDYREYTVEGDWSGAAFLLVAGAIAGPVMVAGLDLNSTQADKSIVDALMAANAAIAMEAKGIRIHPVPLNGFYFDATDCPDLFPPLVALAAYCKGETTIKGVSRLTHKESNRALTLQDEFDKMGITIDLQDDLMIITGGTPKGADCDSHHDHRIAMACAVTGLAASSEMVIAGAEAVGKSYPDFFDHLKKLGATVSLPGYQVPEE